MTDLESIRAALAGWYRKHARKLPWRETSDPYAILVSEIMLQQTRVAAVIPYYARFLARYPNAQALADAPEAELLATWAGLGYYSRARNLQAAARAIATAGTFPRDHQAILGLKGIGDYTAAAVASIAFAQPHAVLDGNVVRVLSRLFLETGDVQSNVVRARLRERAQQLLDPAAPGLHNQAVMELGATVCTPRDPACGKCPVVAFCQARAMGRERELPVKSRRISIEQVHRTLLAVRRSEALLMWRRPDNDPLMAGFWELPEPHQAPRAVLGQPVFHFKHGITNKLYRFDVVLATVRRVPPGLHWVHLKSLGNLPASTVVRKALAGLRQLTLFE